MSDIKALIVRNDLSLEKSKVDYLTSLIGAKSSMSYLSPEKEAGPFLLYCCGDDFQTISTKTNYPVDIILLTAIYYRWPEKAKSLQKEITEQSIGELQKDIAKSMLVATYITIQKQLGDVIAGRIDPEKSGLIPKNLQGLEKLMTMVSDILNPKAKESSGKAPGQTTNIQAQNVQVVNAAPLEKLPEKAEEMDPAKKAAHEAKLKALGEI